MRVIFLALVAFVLIGSQAHAACGDRGGPGYRGPDGKCVGWAEFAKKCGSPPTKFCTAENVQSASVEEARERRQRVRTNQTAP